MTEQKAGASARVEERLKDGDRRFSKLEQRLDRSDREVREHLQSQDEKIAAIAAAVTEIKKDTRVIVETWDEGTRAVRFFCRIAQGWRFVLRQVLFPVVIPCFALYAVLFYAVHGHFPLWLADTVKLILAIV